ncbi:hypothetical protein G5714_011698 [Onychostoma macrolepis]|uniref:Uncharacterized protein n=1 Tax=Onychostoma macrolepis TaxID=369639 RepID=A0A7J6CJN4_9TELE|nr:hypothetical protein G5714_011698 [Onychostoma macrolepis]
MPRRCPAWNIVGVEKTVDRDCPFKSLQLPNSGISGGDSGFTIDPVRVASFRSQNRELHLEEKQDFDQDVDRTKQQTGATDVTDTVQVQNVKDKAPACDPIHHFLHPGSHDHPQLHRP